VVLSMRKTASDSTSTRVRYVSSLSREGLLACGACPRLVAENQPEEGCRDGYEGPALDRLELSEASGSGCQKGDDLVGQVDPERREDGMSATSPAIRAGIDHDID